MDKKPVIGIMPLWDEKRSSIWMYPGYTNGIIRAGGVPLILPYSDNEEVFTQALEMCDGCLITGGQDISPSIYGEEKKFDSVATCQLRDRLETILLDKAIELDKPLLGICRGLQFMNAALGGTLYQDIPSEFESNLIHLRLAPDEPAMHEVIIEPDTPLENLLNERSITVNSYHHQAIKELSPIMKRMARSFDGLTEAAYLPLKKFIWGIQWHPEMTGSTDKNSELIFKNLVVHSDLFRKGRCS